MIQMRTITDKQLGYLNTLVSTRDLSELTPAQSQTLTDDNIADLTVAQASQAIDIIRQFPYAKSAATVGAGAPITEDGMYELDGKVYKVQVAVHGSGNLYAKELDTEEGGFSYAPGVVRKLTTGDKMSLERAKELGSLYGTCCSCGRTLTDESSIEAGIGPVCASKF